MRKLLFITIFLTQLFGQYPDATEVMQKIDQNMSSDNQIIVSTMVIHGRRSSRSITSKSWVQRNHSLNICLRRGRRAPRC